MLERERKSETDSLPLKCKLKTKFVFLFFFFSPIPSYSEQHFWVCPWCENELCVGLVANKVHRSTSRLIAQRTHSMSHEKDRRAGVLCFAFDATSAPGSQSSASNMSNGYAHNMSPPPFPTVTRQPCGMGNGCGGSCCVRCPVRLKTGVDIYNSFRTAAGALYNVERSTSFRLLGSRVFLYNFPPGMFVQRH